MNNFKIVKNNNWKEVEVNGEFKEVPIGWITGCLTDICEIKGGISAPKDFVNKEKENTLPFFRVSNLSTRKKFLTDKETKEFLPKGKYKSFSKDAILIAKSGESIRQKYRSFLTQESVVVGHIAILLSSYNKDYLYNLLMYFSPEDILLKDSTMPSLSITELGKFQIYYPPISQQSSIATVLSKQEQIISNMETLITKLENRFTYLSDVLLSGKIRVKEVDGKTVLYKNTEWKEVEVNGEMKEIPSDWEVQKIAEVTKCLDNKRKALNQTERSNIKGLIPYWGANSIVDYVKDYLIDEEVVLLGEDAAPFYDKSKRVAFLSKGKIWPNNHIHVLKSLIDSRFLVNILNQVKYEKIIGAESRPKLTQGMMNNIKFILPQNKEVEILCNIIEKNQKIIELNQTLLNQEKQKFEWLLDNLLSGKYLIQ